MENYALRQKKESTGEEKFYPVMANMKDFVSMVDHISEEELVRITGSMSIRG